MSLLKELKLAIKEAKQRQKGFEFAPFSLDFTGASWETSVLEDALLIIKKHKKKFKK